MKWLLEKGVGIGASGLFSSLCILNGTPAFRHDWMWPTNASQFTPMLVNSFSGWSSDGIGSATPQMLDFIVNLPIVGIGELLGPIVSLFCWMFIIALVIGYGARRICNVLGRTDPYSVSAAVLLATFNPWTYDHLVAGHTHMLIAYGATLALISHALQRPLGHDRRSDFEAAALVFLAMAQLQYFLVDALFVSVISVRRRTFVPIAAFVVAILPTAVGVWFDATNLKDTPYTLAWERLQALPMRQSWDLAGYFARYDAAIPGWALASFGVGLAAAVVGGLASGTRAAVAAILGGASLLLLVSGERTFIGAAVLKTMTLVPQLRIFRELDDLLGLLVPVYLIAILAARWQPLVRTFALVGCMVMVIGWLCAPPSIFWVDGRAVQRLPEAAVAPDSRFAVFPSLQPSSYLGRGSGINIQTFPLSNGRTSLNEYLALYPASAALSRFSENGDNSGLKALSVSAVFVNSKVASDSPEEQRIPALRGDEVRFSGFLPLLSLCNKPLIGRLDANFGACNEFIGDVPGNALHVIPISAPTVSTDPAKDWIDARLAFSTLPLLGQPFGGAYTRGRRPFHLSGQTTILSYIAGSLYVDGAKRIDGNGSYGWYSIPNGAKMVWCDGSCVIAATASRAPDNRLPMNPPARGYRKVDFAQVLPWMALAYPRASGVIRYNVAFHKNWVALDRCGLLSHVRLDGVINGWSYSTCAVSPVIIIFAPALAQFLLAVMALAFALAVVARLCADHVVQRNLSSPWRCPALAEHKGGC